ncbi:hypothetical protein DSECCO2_514110 [anaerobic digester metagenome]
MDFINKKHIIGFKRGEQSGQIAWFFNHRAAGNLDAYAHFIGQNVRQGCFTESGRAVEQGMIECFAALAGSPHKYQQIIDHLFLAHEFMEIARPQHAFNLALGLCHGISLRVQIGVYLAHGAKVMIYDI